MARQWVRIGSIAAAVLIALLVLSSINYLPQGRALFEASPFKDGDHEPEAPYRPQAEEQVKQPAVDTTPTINEDLAKPPEVDTHHDASETAASTPAAPSPTELTKAIVMGKLTSEDTDWVAQELIDWQRAIYVVDLEPNVTSPTGFRTKINKSKEAMPYLTYIIDHYPNFPDVMVFIHAHRKGYPKAWHNEAKGHDAVLMLRALRLDVVAERGYVNLRCTEVPGCPDEIQPWRNPPDPEKLPEHIYPYVYADFFNMPLSQVRKEAEVVSTPCCAQFAVSREQTLKRPKEDYEHYRNYLEETTYDDDTIGRVLEYMWHIIFGRSAVHCDNAMECQCKVFGRCSKKAIAEIYRDE